jgi:hypothetical protein
MYGKSVLSGAARDAEKVASALERLTPIKKNMITSKHTGKSRRGFPGMQAILAHSESKRHGD